jgi:hypothetical protein
MTRMPRATRLFLAGNTVSMAGTGLVIAFTLIYLHQVRGLALPVVGALLAVSLFLAFTGYAAFDSGLSAFSTVQAHLSRVSSPCPSPLTRHFSSQRS